MKLYRLHKPVDNGVSAGYAFFGNKQDAEKAARQHDRDNGPQDIAEMTVIDVEPTKHGILAALNQYASHPDNG